MWNKSLCIFTVLKCSTVARPRCTYFNRDLLHLHFNRIVMHQEFATSDVIKLLQKTKVRWVLDAHVMFHELQPSQYFIFHSPVIGCSMSLNPI